MPSSWRDIEVQLAAYRKRRWQPALWAVGSIGAMLVLGIASNNLGLGLLPLFVGFPAALYLSSTIGVRCPWCHRLMNDLGARGASLLTLLVNLRQCPLCQHKFDDAA